VISVVAIQLAEILLNTIPFGFWVKRETVGIDVAIDHHAVVYNLLELLAQLGWKESHFLPLKSIFCLFVDKIDFLNPVFSGLFLCKLLNYRIIDSVLGWW